MECLLPYLCMVTVSHIMVRLERMLDYRGVGLARFHCNTYTYLYYCIPSHSNTYYTYLHYIRSHSKTPTQIYNSYFLYHCTCMHICNSIHECEETTILRHTLKVPLRH